MAWFTPAVEAWAALPVLAVVTWAPAEVTAAPAWVVAASATTLKNWNLTLIRLNLIGQFEFSATDSKVDINALFERYADPDCWHKSLQP